MNKRDKRDKTVEDLQLLLGTKSKSKIAGILGKGATTVSNWVNDGVPDGVWKVAVSLAQLETKKTEQSSISETILGITDKLSPEGQAKALEAIMPIFISEQTDRKSVV